MPDHYNQPQLPVPNPSTYEGNFAEPFFKTAFQEAFRQYNLGPQQFFQGPTVAGFAPQQLEAMRQTQAMAPAMQNIALGQAGVMRDFMGQPLDLQPASPEMQRAIASPYLRQLQEQTLPQIGSAATQAGAFGGSRADILKGQASAAASGQIADALARNAMAERQQRIGMAQTGFGMAPQLRQSMMAAPALLSSVGGQEQQMTQQLIDAARERHQFEQTGQQRALNTLLGQLGGMPQGLAMDKAVAPSGLQQGLGFLTGLAGLGIFG